MTRDEKIETARRLRGEGLRYREIGERLGVSLYTAYDWVNPENKRNRDRKQNARPEVKAAKRAWDRAETNRGRCACGALLGQAARCRDTKQCAGCYHRDRLAETAERGRQIEQWWAAGLSLNEIAGRLGWTRNHIGVEIDRLRRKGFYLPYRNRGYSKYAEAA